MFDVVLRPAEAGDAHDIARVLRAALAAFEWMPLLHTPDEDLYFVRHVLLAHQAVTVVTAADRIVGFISIKDDWVEQLYFDPDWTGRGIGSRLLRHATSTMPRVQLHCFQANSGARRFYECHDFRAEAFGDGSGNEEGLPDVLYVREDPAGSWLNG